MTPMVGCAEHLPHCLKFSVLHKGGNNSMRVWTCPRALELVGGNSGLGCQCRASLIAAETWTWES